MKTKTRRIMPAVLAVVMVVSLAALFSCVQSEAEQEIKVDFKIIGSKGEVCSYTGVLQKGAPSDLTVLAVTKFICDIESIEFDYDVQLKAVKRIGDDIGELFRSEYPTDPPPTTEAKKDTPNGDDEDGEETEAPTEAETDPEDIVSDHYYDWVCTVNDPEATIIDRIKDGDNVVWEWKLVKKELD